MQIKQVFKKVDYLCHKAVFTNVTYYMTSFSLDEAADGLHYESEVIDGSTFAERMQRKINKDRATKEIFEGYLLKEGTRFFNAIVTTIIPLDSDDRGFLEEEDLGMNFVKLSIKKDCKKFVLDGQHRLYALRKLRQAIIDGRVTDQDLKDIKIPIIFIVYKNLPNNINETEKIREQIINETRTVFTSLNKTAKPIDKYTALITDDGDLSAVAARKLLESGDLNENFIKWSIPSSSLTGSDPYFSTLSIINDFFDICESNFNTTIDSNLTYEDRMKVVNDKYFDHVEELGFAPHELVIEFYNQIKFFKKWEESIILLNIILPKQPLLPKINAEDKKIIKTMRIENILATVVGQKALFGSILSSYNKMGKTKVEKSKIIFNKINFLLSKGFFNRNDKIWESILVRNDKNSSMITRNANVMYAEKLISIILRESKKSVDDFSKDVSYELGAERLHGRINHYIDLLESQDFKNLDL